MYNTPTVNTTGMDQFRANTSEIGLFCFASPLKAKQEDALAFRILQ